MASAGGNDSNGDNATDGPMGDSKSLQEFITAQMAEQSLNRDGSPGENIDDDKLNRFLSRALSESRRMTQEVVKSEAKLTKLHEELGAGKMTAWRQEHSAEVLSPQQCQLVEMSQPKPS